MDIPEYTRSEFDDFDGGFGDLPPQGSRARQRSPARRKSGNKAGIITAAIIGGVAVLAGIVVGVVFLVKAGNKDEPGDPPKSNLAKNDTGNRSGIQAPGGNIGRGPGSTAYRQHDRFFDQVSQSFEEVASAMRSVRDRRSARLAADRINQATAALEQQAGVASSLPRITAREKREIQRKYQHRLRGMGYSSGIRSGKASQGEPSFVSAMQRFSLAVNRLKPFL